MGSLIELCSGVKEDSEACVALWERRGVDLTVEGVIPSSEWQSLCFPDASLPTRIGLLFWRLGRN